MRGKKWETARGGNGAVRGIAVQRGSGVVERRGCEAERGGCEAGGGGCEAERGDCGPRRLDSVHLKTPLNEYR